MVSVPTRHTVSPKDRSLSSAHDGHPAACRVALGVVTYNNPATHLRRLVQSIDLAASRLDPARHDAALLTLDCGEAAEWSRTMFLTAGFPTRGTWVSVGV